MSVESIAITASLVVLTVLLGILWVRGLRRFLAGAPRTELYWSSGLALAALAMAVEAVAYAGVVTSLLLELYVFASAAIVGILSLGATKVLRSPRLEKGYTAYMLVGCAIVGVASFATPLPESMVTAGIITGNPPVLLIVLSTLVTGPATIVLLAASVVALRRSWRWQTLLMIAGALVLGAGGTLYIASFPVALYYAEFIGIILLFLGLISLPHSAPASRPASAARNVS